MSRRLRKAHLGHTRTLTQYHVSSVRRRTIDELNSLIVNLNEQRSLCNNYHVKFHQTIAIDTSWTLSSSLRGEMRLEWLG